MKNNRLLFLITLFYFAISFINIQFALIGLICMGIPLFLLFKDKKKTWCQGLCPRASLFTTLGKVKPYKNFKTPKAFIQGNIKWLMLAYFGINLFIIIMSTTMVAIGKVAPITNLRIFFILKLANMPQLISFSFNNWLLHLSYRFYSMMTTTTVLGLILATAYKPRTWCTVCPINTISDLYIPRQK